MNKTRCVCISISEFCSACSWSLVVIVTGMYARRAWQQAHERKKAPPAVPVSVTQRSATFAFSKVEGDRTLFTVRASRATEFKEGNKNLLEDVLRLELRATGVQMNDNLKRDLEEVLTKHGGKIEFIGHPTTTLEALFLRIIEESKAHPGRRYMPDAKTATGTPTASRAIL